MEKKEKLILIILAVTFLLIIFFISFFLRHESNLLIYHDNEIKVTFLGELSNEQIFGVGKSIIDYVNPLDESKQFEGRYFNKTPNWLKFEYEINGVKRIVLIAKKPILNFVSWNGLARGGLVFGDDSIVSVDGVDYVQDAKIRGVDGLFYRVRLLDCGGFTMDNLSEWNLLIGGVHEGDGDFNGFKWDGFSWIENPYTDKDLQIGLEGFGTATWCKETVTFNKKLFAVNRGYFTVSRFHLTETAFRGSAFSWRPILELLD